MRDIRDTSDMKTLTISRVHGNPRIYGWVDDCAIGLKVEIDDYLVALSQEMGPAKKRWFNYFLPKEDLSEKMKTASAVVFEKMKESSVEVV